MSQQASNRFLVLKEQHVCEDNGQLPITKLHISQETQTMSETPLPEKIYIRSFKAKLSTSLGVQLQTVDTGAKMVVSALLDSGATGLFLDKRFVQENHLNTRKLPRAIPVYNVDGTLNQGGSIQEEVDLIMHFKDHSESVSFAVCDLGEKVAIVGHTWLYCHNPEINWQTGEVKMSRCPPQCHFKVQEERKERRRQKKKERRKKRTAVPLLLHEEEEEEQINWNGDRIFVAFIQPGQEINATQNVSQRLAEEALKKEPKKEFDKLVPKEYHSFKDVFSKESFDELPKRKPWDHAIELKPGSEPHSTKV